MARNVIYNAGNSYIGVRATTPPNLLKHNHDPGPNNLAMMQLGTLWLNTSTKVLWYLPAFTNTGSGPQAVWLELSGGSGTVTSLHTPDGNTVTPNLGVINFAESGSGLTITGTNGSNTVTFTLSDSNAQSFVTDSGPATPAANVLNIKANVATLNAGSSVEFTGSGSTVLLNVTDSNNNTIVGKSSGKAGITGTANTVFGEGSLTAITSGSKNIVIGQAAGTSYTSSESSNILIGNTGTAAESNVLRIGTQGSSSGQINAAYIAGIYGASPSSALPVVINSSGQLGTSALIPTNSFNTLNIQTFTSSGTYTPTANMQYCLIEVVGGGGGAGYANDSSAGQATAGAAGGAGGYARGFYSAATIGASQSVTIGAAGVGGTTNSTSGTNGGTTSVGSLLSASGGTGGTYCSTNGNPNYCIGGTGGTGTGGNFQSTGGGGGAGWGLFITGGNYVCDSGPGGISYFGGGARANGAHSSGSTAEAGVGVNATTYGGGGSGGYCQGAATGGNGGNGSAGVVIITEFIS